MGIADNVVEVAFIDGVPDIAGFVPSREAREGNGACRSL
jgi:hypothetical protein